MVHRFMNFLVVIPDFGRFTTKNKRITAPSHDKGQLLIESMRKKGENKQFLKQRGDEEVISFNLAKSSRVCSVRGLGLGDLRGSYGF